MKTESLLLFTYLTLDILSFSLVLPCFSKIAVYLINNSATDESFSNFILSKGIIWSTTSFSQFIFSPILGHFSDIYGRKPLIYFNSIVQILANLVWLQHPDSFTTFLLVRLVIGMSRSNIGIVTAYISDVYSLQERSKGMAIVGVSYSLAFLIGPMMGVVLSNRVGEDIPAKCGVISTTCLILNLLSIIPFARIKEDHIKSKSYSHRELLNPIKMVKFSHVKDEQKRRLFCYYAFSYIAFIVAFSGLETALVYIGDDMYNYSSRDQGCMFSLIGVVMIIIQGSILRRQKIFSNIKLVLVAFLCLILSLLCIGLVQEFHPLFVVGQIFFAITSSLYVPSMNSQTSIIGDPKTHGLTMGIFRSLNAFSRSIGPLVISTLLWTFGIRISVIASSTMIGLLAFDFNRRNHLEQPLKKTS